MYIIKIRSYSLKTKTANFSNGNLGVSWYTFNLNGITLKDKEPIFYMEFQVLAGNKETTSIAFGNSPTPISFADPSESFQINAVSSTLKIDANAVAVSNTSRDDIEVKLIPNPAFDYLNIISEQLKPNSSIEVLDLNGRSYDIEVLQHSKNGITLNVSDLAPGLYMVLIRDSNRSSVNRFVKSR